MWLIRTTKLSSWEYDTAVLGFNPDKIIISCFELDTRFTFLFQAIGFGNIWPFTTNSQVCIMCLGLPTKHPCKIALVWIQACEYRWIFLWTRFIQYMHDLTLATGSHIRFCRNTTINDMLQNYTVGHWILCHCQMNNNQNNLSSCSHNNHHTRAKVRHSKITLSTHAHV